MSRDKAKSETTRAQFPFLQVNERDGKQRKYGLTEIRGPYYSVVGRRYLEDLFEMMGAYVDALKFPGGSFALMPEDVQMTSAAANKLFRPCLVIRAFVICE